MANGRKNKAGNSSARKASGSSNSRTADSTRESKELRDEDLW